MQPFQFVWMRFRGDDEDQEIAKISQIARIRRYGDANAPTADASPADAQVAPFYEKV